MDPMVPISNEILTTGIANSSTILEEVSNTQDSSTTGPREKDMEDTLVGLFDNVAKKLASNVAVIFDNGQQQSVKMLSYHDVTVQCFQISNTLKTCGLKEECIGIFGQLSSHTIPALLGIMKAGCYFCPLHSDHPKAYFQTLVKRLQMRAFLIREDTIAKLNHLNNDMPIELIPMQGELTLALISSTSQGKGLNIFAYCITTSGTTGEPKIVKVPHQCIVPNITSISKMYGLTSEDIVCQVSPLTFDPSIVEIFTALSCGSCLLMTPDILKKSPRIFNSVMQAHNVTVLQGTPTLIQNLDLKVLLGENSSLRVLSFGGEACPAPEVIRSSKHVNNKTLLFNLYGITEVSCWATCCQITACHLGCDKDIPLGLALDDTALEVRNEGGEVITNGTGFLFIGGHRQCLLDKEDTFEEGRMRNSGDLVHIDDKGEMYYVGRKDDQIKRHGKRINLLELEKETLKVEEIAQSTAVVLTDKKLYLVVKLADGKSTRNVTAKVLQMITDHLPSYYKPDDVFICEDNLPYNRHGKIDKMKLQQFVSGIKESKKDPVELLSLSEILCRKWKKILNLEDDLVIGPEKTFLEMGGDSFSAVRLLEAMEIHGNTMLPNFLDILLSGTYGELKEYLESNSNKLKRKIEDETLGNSKLPVKRRNTYELSSTRRETVVSSCADISTKVKESNAVTSSVKHGNLDVDHFHEFSHGNCVQSCEVRLCEKCDSHSVEANAVIAVRRSSRVQLYCQSSVVVRSIFMKSKLLTNMSSGNYSLNLQQSWTCNLGKCIDASPLVLRDSDSLICYLGSHSHVFKAVDMEKGSVLWEAMLGDRIESSAVLSKCTNFVIVGCYDGKLYVLDRKTGNCEWTFNTKGQVKCSPEVDPLTGIVITGSHSHAVYGLNIKKKDVVWCQKAIGGSVYSSPLIHCDPHHLYVASLSGRLHCFNPINGDEIWHHDLQMPVFSSPNSDENQVVLGCVDGMVNSFSHEGQKLWCFKTDSPVFSSPSCTSTGSVIFGSHDKHVYCLSQSGLLLWKYMSHSAVCSSPYVVSFCDIHYTIPGLVIACDTSGQIYIINLDDGKLVCSYALPGEVFSSPLFYDDKVVVGCRNDEIYCFNLTCDYNDIR